MPPSTKVEAGDRFASFTVEAVTKLAGTGRRVVQCVCDCGHRPKPQYLWQLATRTRPGCDKCQPRARKPSAATAERRAGIVAAYLAGDRLTDICGRFGVSQQTVARAVKLAGAPARPNGRPRTKKCPANDQE